MKNQKYCLYDDVYHELLFDRLQYLCGTLNLILKTDDHWAIAETVTKLNAVCLGRSSQALFSRDNLDYELISLDIGHLINDNTTLGWLLNPRVQQSEITKDILEGITAEIKKGV